MKKTGIIASWILLVLLSCTPSKVPTGEAPEHFTYNPEGNGPAVEIEMIRGEAHNHPLMAIWAENPEGKYLQTLYVAGSVGKGFFRHGNTNHGFWEPGEIRRPAALPYWAHKRGIKAEDGLFLPTPRESVADAYTGPTPSRSFIIRTRLDEPGQSRIRILFEINQTWDWNEYWTNDKFPDDNEYKTSSQPALVYASAVIDLTNPGGPYELELIGRSHQSGANGELYHDLETMTTALRIADKITVRFPE